MTSTQVVEMSVNVTNTSPSPDPGEPNRQTNVKQYINVKRNILTFNKVGLTFSHPTVPRPERINVLKLQIEI